MPESASKAVFLSYASQDAAAVSRIAEALRAAGAEVWFDQNELVGGDAWDQKIRRQIKDCALFVPVISANTNARSEGYFRLEWKLAVDRSHLLADDHPFLFPVVIDDTSDAAARVPDKFREVQWTRLNVKDTPDSLARRVTKILGGAAPAEMSAGAPGPAPFARQSARSRFWTWFGYACGVGAVILGVMLAFRAAESRRSREAPPVAAALGSPAQRAPGLSPTEQTIARAYAMFDKMSYTRSNLAAAEDLLKKATEQASDSAHVWGARAYVQACFILRGWDTSQQRREAAQEFANRALALDPNETDALLALTYVLNQQGAFAQSEGIARRAIAIRPDDSRLHRSLGAALSGAGRTAEAFAVRQENVRLFPRDPLIFYDLALLQRAQGDFAGAIASFDQSIALQPFASALLQRAMLTAAFTGDLASARATLDRLEPADRTEDRAVGVAAWLALLEHKPERVIDAASLTARVYLDDVIERNAKASWVALAYEFQGKTALARQQWEAAELVLRGRLTEAGATAVDRALWATTLARLGRPEEAAREIAGYEATAREQTGPTTGVPPQVALAFFYAAMGDAPKAVTYARAALNRTHFISDYTFALDPQWDKVRAAPEFVALQAEANARIAAAKNGGAKITTAPNEKSAAAPISEGRKLTLQARALIDDDWLAVRENFRNADDLCERATKLDPLDGEAWGTWSRVAAEMIIRNYDSSPQRMEAARSRAERALQLAPDSVEGNLALALVLRLNQSAKDATQRLRTLLARAPMDARVARALAATLSPPGVKANPEASDIRLNHPAFGGKDPRPLMDESRTMHDSQRFAECESLAERAGTMAPCLEYYRFRLVYPAYSVNEPEASRTVLAQLPARLLQEDVFAALGAGIWLKLGNGDNALMALRRVPRDYFEDIWVSGTKGLRAGRAHALAGRTAAAQAEWNQALVVIDQRLVLQPNDPYLLGEKALLLALVGRREEAEKTWQLTAELRRWPRGEVGLTRAEILLAEGETEAAIRVIESNLVPVSGGRVLLTVNMIHTDPWFAAVRDDPRVRKILADGDALIRKFREKPAPAPENK